MLPTWYTAFPLPCLCLIFVFLSARLARLARLAPFGSQGELDRKNLQKNGSTSCKLRNTYEMSPSHGPAQLL